MAEVFRAVMPGAQGFRQTFVVKRILAERSRAADFVDMFVHEARICALLSHPNIVQVFDFGNVDGDYFLAMEYLRGRDVQALLRRLREQNLLCPVPVAAFIAHEVAACLGYAHDLRGADGKRLNIVHRDVSPSNIMCLRTGGVKLLDFGIAKAAGDNSENTEQGLFKGKLAYVAPERIKNEALDGARRPVRAGRRAVGDAGRPAAVPRQDELETLTNVLEMQVPPPSALRPDVPAALDAVVMRALERDRNKRYPTGQAMADDLEAVLRETGFHARMLPDLLREAFGSGPVEQPGDDVERDARDAGVAHGRYDGQHGRDQRDLAGAEAEPPPVTRLSWQRASGSSAPPPPARFWWGCWCGRGGGARGEHASGPWPHPRRRRSRRRPLDRARGARARGGDHARRGAHRTGRRGRDGELAEEAHGENRRHWVPPAPAPLVDREQAGQEDRIMRVSR